MYRFYFLLLFLSISFLSLGQDKKTLSITRGHEAPKIDGILDDAVWKGCDIATGFIQFKPEIGNTLEDQETLCLFHHMVTETHVQVVTQVMDSKTGQKREWL